MPAVNLTVAEGLATIELRRPDALNAWNTALGDELLAAVESSAADPAVRAVLVTGAGRAFSSGADLKDLGGREATPDGHPDLRRVLVEAYHPIILGLRRMDKPVVAAVNGPAVGIGLSLALCCDQVVAAESAYLLLAFVNIGLVPDGGSSIFVPARVGYGRAAQLAMLGERLPATTALEWGLVDRVVADDALRPEAEALARRLAAGPTRAYAGIKRQLNASVYARLDEQLALEADIQQEMASSSDFVEGVGAFVSKRQPVFTGT
ncbi:MAG TPA: enoyl-CoA hydratase-related protein [Capillimicrobium sp.]|jgi:2-(1,2-epoxy-1,2-dihydrophenyl)acetyl-CoA isomerase